MKLRTITPAAKKCTTDDDSPPDSTSNGTRFRREAAATDTPQSDVLACLAAAGAPLLLVEEMFTPQHSFESLRRLADEHDPGFRSPRALVHFDAHGGSWHVFGTPDGAHFVHHERRRSSRDYYFNEERQRSRDEENMHWLSVRDPSPSLSLYGANTNEFSSR